MRLRPMVPSYTGRNLLFVVGAPRSGTTWVQRLLAAHPAMRTGQESRLFTAYVSPQLAAWRWEADRERDSRTATGRGGTGLSCYFTEPEFLKALRNYTVDLLRPMVGSLGPNEWFVEKTPSHACCVSDIHLLLPDARFVHVVRDGRDVVASMLVAQRSWGASWAPRQADRAARWWVRHVRAAQQAATEMPPEQFCEIRYEELRADPARVLRRLALFLGLEWPDADLDAAIRANSAEEIRAGRGTAIPLSGRFASRKAVTEPENFIHRAAVGGWRHDLSLFQRLTVRWVAGDLLRELGYTSSRPLGSAAVAPETMSGPAAPPAA